MRRWFEVLLVLVLVFLEEVYAQLRWCHVPRIVCLFGVWLNVFTDQTMSPHRYVRKCQDL